MAEPLKRIPIEIYRDADMHSVIRVEQTISLTVTGGAEPMVPLSQVVDELNLIGDRLALLGARWLQVELLRALATLFDDCRNQLVGQT